MSEYVSAKAARRANEERERREKKKYTITVSVIVAIVLVLVIFVGLFGSNLFYNKTAAVKIGDRKYSVADFNYNYFAVFNSFYSQYGQLAQLMFPSGVSLRDSMYSEDTSWAQYFETQALARMQTLTMLAEEAEKEGYTLSQAELDDVDATVKTLATSAVGNGFSDLPSYLVYCYGKGMTEKVFRENLLLETLATSFSSHKLDSFTYTDEEIAASYEEHKDEYDYFSFRFYKFDGSAVTDDAETEEDETLSAEDAMNKAKEEADKFVAAVKTEQDYLDYAAELNKDNEDYDADANTKGGSLGSSINSDIIDWLADSARKAGDVASVKTPDDSTSPGYYVLYFLNRDNNDFEAVSGYYGLVPLETEDASDDESGEDEDSSSAISDEAAAKLKAEGTANEILEAYNTDGDKTYDGFAEALAYAQADELISESGALTSVGRNDLPESVVAWLYDESRKEGDTGTVFDEDYGCFILYYTGTDGNYGMLMAESYMKSDAYSAWQEEALKGYTVDTQWEMALTKKISALGG